MAPDWFVVNARDTRWRRRPGRGYSAPLTGITDEERSRFPQLGMQIVVLEPGEPIGMYHWEKDAEGFLVVSGEALLVIEGEERPLRQWDFVHCPPGVRHMILGAGDRRCVIVAAGSRQHMDEDCNGGGYVVDEVARRHGVSVDEETSDPAVAYARFPDSEMVSYPDGLLPG